MAYDDDKLHDEETETDPLIGDSLNLGDEDESTDEDEEEDLAAFGMHVEEEETL